MGQWGFVYALGSQIFNRVAVHISGPSHLAFLLVVDKYPYLREAGDRFQAARLYRALLSSPLLISHIYEAIRAKARGTYTLWVCSPQIMLAPLPVGSPLGPPQ